MAAQVDHPRHPDYDERVMHKPDRPLILLTNDDGIGSPGLWAAAEALSGLGFVTVAAPREQASGTGRSMPVTSDGRLQEEQVQIGGKNWKVFAVGGTPAQAVQHGILELMPRPPDLVVAGINYGENLTIGVSISGTVGAALEGASFGIPALAVSLEMPEGYYLSHSTEIDFTTAGHFARHFARLLLESAPLDDVDVLKVDVPFDATPQTPWRVTRLSRQRYYVPVAPARHSLGEASNLGFKIEMVPELIEPDSDVYAVSIDRLVSVTPLSLDFTSRVELDRVQELLLAPGGEEHG
jgi:5'-nucleotidase